MGLRTVAGFIAWWTGDMLGKIPSLKRVRVVTRARGAGVDVDDRTPKLVTNSLTRLSWLCLGITTLVSRPLDIPAVAG